MTALLAPLQYDFMIKALISAAAVGGVCALLSVYLMLKGWSLVGDALSHAVVPGVALAYLWKLPYALGAFTTGILAAAAMLVLKRLPMLRQDAIIGLVFTSFFAAGLFIISLYPTAINLQAVIYGNILGIDDHDLWQMLAICTVSLAVLAAKWRDLMLYFFDDIQAVTAGLPVARLRWTFFLLVSAAVVAALNAGKLLGYVSDVFPDEPPPADEPLLTLREHPRVLFTPHNAWASVGAQQELWRILSAQVSAFIAEK